MAGNCTQTTALATTPSIHNWWPDLHACSLSSWSSTNNDNNNNSSWKTHELNINSESSVDHECFPVSSSLIITASNHSGLSGTVESSSELIGETAIPENQIWNRAFLNEGNNGGLESSLQSEQLLGGLWHSKNIPGDIYDTARDSTGKHGNSSILPSIGSFNINFERQFNAQRVPNFAGNWYNFPPQDGDIDDDDHQQIELPSDVVKLSSAMKDPYSFSGVDKIMDPTLFSFGHDHDTHRMVLGNRNFGNISSTNSRSFTELLPPVGDIISRPSGNSTPVFKTLDLSGFGKQVFQSSPFPSQKAISSSNPLALQKRNPPCLTSGGKKRKSVAILDPVLKKPKPDAAVTPSTKAQFPKAKLVDKISALQQIVSPFGKTDTASVLGEAIACIRFLEEQTQLFCSPYVKENATKELWVGLNRKVGGDGKLDLKSRGLCLVPISCAPQLYRDNNTCIGSDYLTPIYRGCLHR